MTRTTIRITLALPADLVEAVDRAVRAGRARSRSELVARLLRHELAAGDRRAIDAVFAEMADDPVYQAEARAIASEFAVADWEAARRGDLFDGQPDPE